MISSPEDDLPQLRSSVNEAQSALRSQMKLESMHSPELHCNSDKLHSPIEKKENQNMICANK